MTAHGDHRDALIAALAWQLELGADEAIGDMPLDRFAESEPPKPTEQAPGTATQAPAAVVPPPSRGERPVPDAIRGREERETAPAIDTPSSLAAKAATLEDLASAMRGWNGSPLKEAARNFVFSDGLAGAHLMVIGEAPGQEEDRQGKPFVGRAGQLLDRMLAAIGISRTETDPAKAAYITNILPWRPVGNRTPTPEEAALFLPFVLRHIALAKPRMILAMGNTPTKALLDTTTGIRRMRGRWTDHAATGLRLLPSFHPAYLLRQPAEKKFAWQDLVEVRKALDGMRS